MVTHDPRTRHADRSIHLVRRSRAGKTAASAAKEMEESGFHIDHEH
jgi:hypothetical protein